MPTQSLNCPSCGAGASSDEPNCSHCGGLLATVACPKCFHLMFRNSKFCSACGASAVAWQLQSGGLACPECEQPMLKGSVGACLFHHCGRCHGIWLDSEEFSRVCRDADHQSALLGAPQVAGSGAPTSSVAIRYRPCPRCRDRMNRVNFAKCSGVVVDCCRTHGTWFDRDELNRILQFIQRGGLQKSRAHELEYLESERRRGSSALGGPLPDVRTGWIGSYPSDWPGFALYSAVRVAGWILEGLL